MKNVHRCTTLQIFKHYKGQHVICLSDAVLDQYEKAKAKRRRRIVSECVKWKPPVFTRDQLRFGWWRYILLHYKFSILFIFFGTLLLDLQHYLYNRQSIFYFDIAMLRRNTSDGPDERMLTPFSKWDRRRRWHPPNKQISDSASSEVDVSLVDVCFLT